MRLLYVDDDRVITMLFEEICRREPGLDLRTAADGEEALVALVGWSPDLFVIDLHLPDTDGLALLARLRAQPGLADCPAYLCTADDAAPVLDQARAAGFDGCWGKPMDAAVLRAELARLSTQRRLPGASTSIADR